MRYLAFWRNKETVDPERLILEVLGESVLEIRDYTEQNRRAWNKATPLHQEAKQDKFFKAFKKPGYSSLDRIITAEIRRTGIDGKPVGQICCNDGREALSLINLGAKSTVGFDISDDAINEARKLSQSSGIKCEFVRCDAYEISADYDSKFDFIYISIGVFGWMPDLDQFFGVVSRLLKAGGELLVYEQHPFAEVFDQENRSEPLKIANPYFNDKPLADDAGMDYWGGKQYKGEVSCWFAHTLGDIFGGMIKNGIEIRGFQEYEHDISSCWEHIEKTGKKLPLSYILCGQKRQQ